MTFHHRIRTIYRKELIDILRDHRTLIAMIVVPIVLYPLLLLGSVQAVSYQEARFREEVLVIGVINDAQAQALERVIRADAKALEREKEERAASKTDATPNEQDAPQPIEHYRILPLGAAESIEQAVTERRIHVGVLFENDVLIDAPDITNRVRFFVDEEDPRSHHAFLRLRDVFDRTAERTRAERLAAARLPPAFVKPFDLEVVNLAAPQSILGQVLPLILVLMTITGAIYPAIDLTAGERERGTLESLMVCPIPVLDLIVGKFLVVTTVAIMGAALNLGSVSATVYFGGFRQIVAQQGGGIPIGSMVFILLCLVPFAVFMSAIMIAVCSFARTFKEAQNYVTPVILAVLIPGGVAALPTSQLEGVMLVMPVGNMVLLAREMLMGAPVPTLHVLMIVLSTTLYAAAAVAVAANVFGRESVVFADAGSLRTLFDRSLIRPAPRPSVSMSLLTVAILFPIWFFVQSALQPGFDGDVTGVLIHSAWLMPLLFVLTPLMIALYWRVDLREAFALYAPRGRYLAAALLIGLSAWVFAHELNVLQIKLFGVPEAVVESAARMEEALRSLPTPLVFLVIAVVPALCEEALFRGFLLSGLRERTRRLTAVAVSAVVFGVFHFFLFKFPVTAALGAVLALLCWEARSIWPAVIAHALHNGIGALAVVYPQWQQLLGIAPPAEGGDAAVETYRHLPIPVLIVGGLMLGVGLLLMSNIGTSRERTPAQRPVVDAG